MRFGLNKAWRDRLLSAFDGFGGKTGWLSGMRRATLAAGCSYRIVRAERNKAVNYDSLICWGQTVSKDGTITTVVIRCRSLSILALTVGRIDR